MYTKTARDYLAQSHGDGEATDGHRFSQIVDTKDDTETTKDAECAKGGRNLPISAEKKSLGEYKTIQSGVKPPHFGYAQCRQQSQANCLRKMRGKDSHH